MKYDRSAELLERSQKVMGGGTVSDIRAHWGRFQLILERGAGSRVWDVDGNEYIDYTAGGGPLLLGHCFPAVVEAVKAQLEKGIIFGAQTELDIRLAELVRNLVPCADLVRFGSSGSEVVHAALRLARANTGRKKILRFEGHYHGWFDNIAWDSTWFPEDPGPRQNPTIKPLSPGQSAEDKSNLIILPWNDLALVEDLFQKRGEEIAGIITEPVMSRLGIGPEPGFLEGLRRICDRSGSLLIFDEVVTGFRWALGGAQEYYGVIPDLATFSKGMGGGVVVSALAGREKYMARWREFMPILAGTFSANPLSMAGALAALQAISEEGGERLRHTHAMARLLAEGLENLVARKSLPIAIRKFPPAFHLSFVPPGSGPITDARTFRQTHMALTHQLSFELQERGVRAGPGGWGLTSAHTEQDVAKTLSAASAALDAMKETVNNVDLLQPALPAQAPLPRGFLPRAIRRFKRLARM
jgi:glutamate-1-semialdehyde 2,1-aminomutase